MVCKEAKASGISKCNNREHERSELYQNRQEHIARRYKTVITVVTSTQLGRRPTNVHTKGLILKLGLAR